MRARFRCCFCSGVVGKEGEREGGLRFSGYGDYVGGGGSTIKEDQRAMERNKALEL